MSFSSALYLERHYRYVACHLPTLSDIDDYIRDQNDDLGYIQMQEQDDKELDDFPYFF